MNTTSKKSVLNRLTKAILAVFVFNSLAPGFLLAQIIADPNQPKQPTIHESANGTPQVNIQTPTQGGVSMNHYSQFDVDKNGAILNNSRKDTQTELGGYVKGNPWLATGEADIIVNQVNSANPSYLGGYIEVAGKKADVIIANPSGLNIDGHNVTNGWKVFDRRGKRIGTYDADLNFIKD